MAVLLLLIVEPILYLCYVRILLTIVLWIYCITLQTLVHTLTSHNNNSSSMSRSINNNNISKSRLTSSNSITLPSSNNSSLKNIITIDS